jgi:DoxX-like family
VQERWFSRTYFLKPILFASLSLFWLATGLIAVGPGYRVGLGLMQEGGTGVLSGVWVIAGALADIVIGICIAMRRTTRAALRAAITMSIFYIVAGTAFAPWRGSTRLALS